MSFFNAYVSLQRQACHSSFFAYEGTKIVTAELGNDAGMIGAAGLIKIYILGEKI